jgi:iron complex outermembrane receptor protein
MNGTRVARPALAITWAVALALAVPEARGQAAGATAALDEIVVTARKRDERVQDVPLTIDVLTGDDLVSRGVLRPAELQFAVPGFYVQNFETRATITMRGVGAQIAGGTSAVATHVNGIYQSSSAAQLNRLFDVERVEVLKGPQGTLYGRNSTGGALNVITKQPGSTAEADVSVGFGTFDTVRADAGATVPLSESWSLRTAGSYLKGDGQLTNVVTGRKVANDDFKGGRLTLAGEAGGVKVGAFVQYSQDDDNTQPTLIPVRITNGRASPQLGWKQTALDNPTEATIERKNLLAGLSLEGRIGERYTWRSITGYIDYEDASLIDVNPQPNVPNHLTIQFPQFAEQFSQEFQLLYTGDRANWVLGAYYLDDDQSNERDLLLAPPGLPLFDNSGTDEVQAYAVFLDANYRLTDRLTLNAGVRWNRDEVRNTFVGNGLIDGASFDLSSNEGDPTGRLGLDYKIRDGLMVYGSVSTGFQSGFNQTRTDALTGQDAPDKVDPEKLTAFEVGVKSVLPEDRGFLNVSAFYYDYRDMQVTVGGVFLLPDGSLDPSLPPFFYTDNAGEARIYGLDVQLTEVRLAKHLTFDFVAEYLNAKYEDYQTVTNTRAPINYEGNTLPRAPEFTATTALTLGDLPLGANATGMLRLEYNYRGKTYFDEDNNSVAQQGAIGLVNATARVDLGENWSITATGRNLTNEKFFDFYGGSTFANVGEFRTWEIGAAYRWR